MCNRPGSSHARNLAIDESNGQILAFVDDNVLVSINWLVGLLNVSDFTPADFAGEPVHLWWHEIDPPDWVPEPFDSLLATNYHGSKVVELYVTSAVITINTAYRKEIFDRVGKFRLDLERRRKGTGPYEDVEFNQRTLDGGDRLFYASDSSVQHRVEPSRMSFSAMSRMIFYVGKAKAFARPRLDFRTLLRSVVGNLWLILFHMLSELVSRLVRSGASVFKHRRMWILGLDGLEGMSKRLLGRTCGYSY